jgi:catechol 2,3-dioxygenase-like lactoylglutathione lyase family enzyme
MRLNHVNLVVEDLDGAQDFFRRLFGFVLLDRKGDAVVVMDDGQGFTLVLSNAQAFGGEPPVRYPEGFHVGFILETREEVDRSHERLTATGVDTGRGPRRMRESYSFYFEALSGILFEVSCPV